jgi:hypothetical protein
MKWNAGDHEIFFFFYVFKEEDGHLRDVPNSTNSAQKN